MDRYRIDQESGTAVLAQDGDWVKYREANEDGWELLRRSNLQAETINMLYKCIDSDKSELTSLRAELAEARRHAKVLAETVGAIDRIVEPFADIDKAMLYAKGLP